MYRTNSYRSPKRCAQFVVCLASITYIQIAFAQNDPATSSSGVSSQIDSAEDHYRTAVNHYSQGKWQSAVANFDAYLQQTSDLDARATALFYSAEALIQLQKFDTAKVRFEQIVDRHQDFSEIEQARFRIGEASFLAANHRDAISYLQAFISDSPEHHLTEMAWVYLGDAFLQTKQHDHAISSYQYALERYAKSGHADQFRLGLARAYFSAGKSSEAAPLLTAIAADKTLPHADEATWRLASIQFAQSDYKDVTNTLKTFQTDWPQSQYVQACRRLLGRAHLANQEFELASSQLAALATDTMDANDLFLLALSQYGEKRYPQTLETLDTLVSSTSFSAELTNKVQPLRADALFELGQHVKALTAYQRCIASQENAKETPAWRAQIVASSIALKDIETAEAEYAKLRDNFPADPATAAATYYMAQWAYERGDYTRAKQLFTSIAKDSTPVEIRKKALSGLAWSQLKTNDTAASADSFDAIKTTNSDAVLSSESEMARAQALEQSNRLNAAIAAYRQIASRDPSANVTPLALLKAAQCHHRLKQLEDASQLLETTIQQYPNFERRDAALYELAWTLVDLGKEQEANNYFAKLALDYPESPFGTDANYRMAQQAAKGGDANTAIKLLDRVLATDRDHQLTTHANYLKGQLASTIKDWKTVHHCMSQVAGDSKHNDLTIPAQYWIAEATFRQGKYEEAGRLYAMLSAQTEDRTDHWLGMIPLRLAQVQAHQKNWTEAFRIAREISKQYPNFAQQHEADYLMGRCLSSRANFKEARQAFQRVLDSSSGGQSETAAMAAWMIGETYFLQRQYTEAISAYDRTIAAYRFPKWQAAAHLQAGKCYEAMKQWQRSAEHYTQVLRDFGNTQFAVEAQKRIRLLQSQTGTARSMSNFPR